MLRVSTTGGGWPDLLDQLRRGHRNVAPHGTVSTYADCLAARRHGGGTNSWLPTLVASMV